ncbi:hypothetical protein RF11_15589 [Thelohanellus kitauei]|uniref:ZP domain-containing protein n=1 Tax=Thelohanellus kitauei TaxID=669202 RepID=A0A0C2IPB7_THEKT|nr:hypothetical protein RF11_15589 [Thelohanellus kitauei]
MYINIISMFAILVFIQETETAHRLFNTSLGSRKLFVELGLSVQMSISQADDRVFLDEALKIFDINETQFIMKYEPDQTSWFEIKCNTLDSAEQTEISGCILSGKTSQYKASHSYPIGYRFKLNKNTNYDLSGFQIKFIIQKDAEKFIEFYIYQLYIYFSCSIQMCQQAIEYGNILSVDVTSANFVSPCETDDSKVTVETNPDVLEKIYVLRLYNQSECTPIRFKTLIIILIASSAGVVCLLVYACICCRRKSKETQK